MAKNHTAAAPIDAPLFTSLKDMAFKQATAHDNTMTMASFAIANIANFPNEVSDEARAELYSGYRARYTEINKAKKYAVINDHLILAAPEHETNKSVEKIEIGVDYAYSFSSQEFGKLANTRPELHAIIKPIRENTAIYCSNRLGDLKKAANKILNAGKGRARTANKDFAQFVTEWFNDTALTRMKGAKSRGDNSANVERFTAAKVAFMVEWNKV
jgi:ATP-dependent helicase/DNAse subunit B